MSERALAQELLDRSSPRSRRSPHGPRQVQCAVALKLTNDADGGVALKRDTGGTQTSEYS